MRDLNEAVAKYSEDIRRASRLATLPLPYDSIGYIAKMDGMVNALARSPAYLELETAADRMREPLLELERAVEHLFGSTAFLQFQESLVAANRSLPELHQSIGRMAITMNTGFEAAALQAQTLLGSIGRIPSSVDFVASLPRFDFSAALARELDAARVIATQVDQLRPLFAQVDQLVVEAPDEPTRRFNLRAVMLALFEAATGTDTELSSPKKAMRFYLLLVFLIWTKVSAYHQAELHNSKIADARRLEREQAETIAVLTQGVLQLTQEIDELKRAPAVYLEISEPGTMREAPSGNSARVGRLARGQVVRLLSAFKRWRYVELLDDDLQPTQQRGWIYRRNAVAYDGQ